MHWSILPSTVTPPVLPQEVIEVSWNPKFWKNILQKKRKKSAPDLFLIECSFPFCMFKGIFEQPWTFIYRLFIPFLDVQRNILNSHKIPFKVSGKDSCNLQKANASLISTKGQLHYQHRLAIPLKGVLDFNEESCIGPISQYWLSFFVAPALSVP